VAAALLAPWALGWWAGWYGEQVDTTPAAKGSRNLSHNKKLPRYVVYLDGIGQSTFEYLPDIQVSRLFSTRLTRGRAAN